MSRGGTSGGVKTTILSFLQIFARAENHTRGLQFISIGMLGLCRFWLGDPAAAPAGIKVEIVQKTKPSSYATVSRLSEGTNVGSAMTTHTHHPSDFIRAPKAKEASGAKSRKAPGPPVKEKGQDPPTAGASHTGWRPRHRRVESEFPR